MSKQTIRDVAIAAIVPYLIVAVYSGKAYHIDDPAYLWTARQVLKSPLDFYGFEVNWGSTDVMMYEANKNPPGVSYFIALGAWLFGWGEHAQHLWMGLSASLLGTSTYLLARRLCSTPLFATFAVMSMPVVVVSSTTIMTDVPMLALYTCSVFLWIAGMDRNNHVLLASGAAFAAGAFLTKYFGITLVPLLFAYTVIRTRRVSVCSLHLLIPIAAALGYMAWVYHLYGLNPLAEAASYASGASANQFAYVRAKPLIGVVFTGGCLATVTMYAPFLWRWWISLATAAAALAAFVIISRHDGYFFFTATSSAFERYQFSGHYALFLLGGFAILALALHDLWRTKSADSLLLTTWLAGTFVFATFLNWSVTARTILPMAVPAGILVARALQYAPTVSPRLEILRRWAPLIPAFAVSLLVTYGDYASAYFARQAAQQVIEQDRIHPGHYWFMGHWGYQYYLEESGMRFLTEQEKSDVRPGDRVAIFRWLTLAPMNFDPNTTHPVPDAGFLAANPVLASTHHPLTRSGFYTSALGPLPYTLGPAPDIALDVLEFGNPPK